MRTESSHRFIKLLVLMAVTSTEVSWAQDAITAKPVVTNYRSARSAGKFFSPYAVPSVPQISMANSPRLRDLIKRVS